MPTPPTDTPAVHPPPWWSWRSAFVWLFESVVVFGATYTFSKKIASLSGTALWVPAEHRDAIDLIGGGIAWVFFTVTKVIFDYCSWRFDPKPKPPESTVEPFFKSRPPTRATWVIRFVTAVLAVICMLLLAVTYERFQRLRDRCVISFDPRDWVEGQRLQNADDARSDAARLSAATLPAEVPDPNATIHVPDFVDIKRRLVYLPEEYPPALRRYLDLLDRQPAVAGDGLNYMLAREPDHLFDLLEKQGGAQLQRTTAHFMWLDFTMLALAGVAAAGSEFDIRSFLGGSLAG